MGKTGVEYILKTRPEILKKRINANLNAGRYEGFEYRIRTDDPNFAHHNQYCKKCGEIHRSPWEDHLIHPDVPERIGKNWAKAHHIQSIIESRSCFFEIKVGEKTVYQGTSKDPDSFELQGNWLPYMIISESGKVTIVGKTHTRKKIKTTKSTDSKMNVSKIILGLTNDNAPQPTISEGFVIYTTKESDQGVHEILATFLHCTPQEMINRYFPSDITGYDYRRSLDIKRPTDKFPYWRLYGDRVPAGTLVKRIQEQFPDLKQVKIEISQGIDLE